MTLLFVRRQARVATPATAMRGRCARQQFLPGGRVTKTRNLLAPLFLVLASIVVAQEPTPSPAAVTRHVAHAAAGVVEELFVDVAQAKAVAAELRRKADAGTFDSLASRAVVADALTDAMQAVEDDKHLNLKWKDGDASAVLTAEQALDRFRTQRRTGGGASPFGTPEQQRLANYDVKTARHLAGNVGYLELTAFQIAPETREVIAAAMRMLQNVDAMIVDVRANRGGGQQTVNYLASYFLPADGRELMTIRSRSAAQPMVSRVMETPTRNFEGVPLYILTSGNSFSAGEAFPYILQQYGRATIVGETTRGGGRPNAFVDLGGGFILSVSIAASAHPRTGRGWQGTGVVPDVKVAASDALDAAHRLALEKLGR